MSIIYIYIILKIKHGKSIFFVCVDTPPPRKVMHSFTQPILVSLGAHSLSVAALVVVSHGEGSTFGLL